MKYETVTPVHEAELNEHDKMRLCQIRFDASVRMSDVGFREVGQQPFFAMTDPKVIPQWFAIQQVLTLELVKEGDPYLIGMRIKEMWYKLEEAIKQYENKR
jgi:hypothetical protein